MVKKFIKSTREYRTSGFGNRVEDQPHRLVNQNGTVNVRKSGMGFLVHFSIFHYLVTINWWRFNLLVLFSYLLINILFGALYIFIGVEGIGLQSRGWHADLIQGIYFSAQTFSTVGFGRLNPQNHWINIVSLVEMLVGMMYLALAAGLLFARFSRPVSKIVFSKKAVIAPFGETTGLMLRMANAKENLLFDVSARVLLTLTTTLNGIKQRKFFQLPLEMDQINMLALSWTVVHPIDDESPLNNLTREEFEKNDPEILVLVRGYNSTFSQNIHSQTSYKFSDVAWHAKFKPIFRNHRGKTIVEIDRIDEYETVSTR